jgi:adenosylhomocysteine nucleosidase
MAGGLDPELSPGTIFLPSEVISRDGTAFLTASYWRQRLSAAIAVHRPLTHGKLLTSAQAIEAVADKTAAFRETGAAAVDMESVAVAQLAALHGLPFIAVRVMVDTARDELPRAIMAASRSGHVHIWSLIGALALAPAELGPLIRLAQRYRAARRSLVAVARAGSLAPFAFPTVSDAGLS